jgi:hypothetical protein
MSGSVRRVIEIGIFRSPGVSGQNVDHVLFQIESKLRSIRSQDRWTDVRKLQFGNRKVSYGVVKLKTVLENGYDIVLRDKSYASKHLFITNHMVT